MPTKKQWIAVVCLALLTGCQSIATHHRPEPVTTPRLVDVGGAVRDPQAIEIPSTGLNLVQAITRAGSVPMDGAQDWFVSLQRLHGGRHVTYLMPLQLVNQEVAGTIPLLAGDVVQVLPFRLTRLGAGGQSGESIRVSLRGYLPEPGDYQVTGSLVELFGSESAGGNPLTAGATVATLSRTIGLTTEHYLLPLTMDSIGASPELLSATPKQGDVVTFTRLERVPIVLGGLVADLRRQVADREVEVESRPRTAIPVWASIREVGDRALGWLR